MTEKEALDKILSKVNDEQKSALLADGAVRLIAGAGSGKTYTLTQKVSYNVIKNHIAPSRILSMTFTNKAAEEMKERVAKALKEYTGVDYSNDLQMMTFHSFSNDICREFSDKLNIKNDYTIIPSISVSKIVSRLVDKYSKVFDTLSDMEICESYTSDNGVVSECDATLSCPEVRKYFINGLVSEVVKILEKEDYSELMTKDLKGLSALSNVKKSIVFIATSNYIYSDFKNRSAANHKETNELYRKYMTLKNSSTDSNEVIKVYNDYREAKKAEFAYFELSKHFNEKNDAIRKESLRAWIEEVFLAIRESNSLTFDDLITLCLHLLQTDESVRQEVAGRYDYIQVDEFQDTDYKQLGIVQLLYKDHGNLFVVGDPDQSIYGFRGTDCELFNNLEDYIPNLKTLFLNNNFRSSEDIIEVSNAEVKLNQNRIPKGLKQGHIDNVEAIPNSKIEVLSTPLFTKEDVDKLQKALDIAVIQHKATQTGIKDIVSNADNNYSIDDYVSEISRVTGKGKGLVNTSFNDDIIKKIKTKYEREQSKNLAYMILSSILDLINNKGVKPSDIAILYRNSNSDTAQILKKRLLENNITLDTELNSEDKFFNLAEKFLIYYTTKKDSDYNNLIELFNGSAMTYTYIPEYDISSVSINNEDDLCDALDSLNGILKDTGKTMYKKGTDRASVFKAYKIWESLTDEEKDKLCGLSENSDPLKTDKVVSLANIKNNISDTGLKIYTMHKSKGLEWKYVYVVDLENNKLLNLMSVAVNKGADQLDEVTRLIYVAMSRAKEKLYLCTIGSSAFISTLANSSLSNHIDFKDYKANNADVDALKNEIVLRGSELSGNFEMVDKQGNLVGYRHIEYIDGRQFAYDVQKDVIDKINEKYDKDTQKINIFVSKNRKKVIVHKILSDGHMITTKEKDRAIEVRDLTAEDEIRFIFGNNAITYTLRTFNEKKKYIPLLDRSKKKNIEETVDSSKKITKEKIIKKEKEEIQKENEEIQKENEKKTVEKVPFDIVALMSKKTRKCIAYRIRVKDKKIDVPVSLANEYQGLFTNNNISYHLEVVSIVDIQGKQYLLTASDKSTISKLQKEGKDFSKVISPLCYTMSDLQATVEYLKSFCYLKIKQKSGV